jgi:hypothetical protein
VTNEGLVSHFVGSFPFSTSGTMSSTTPDHSGLPDAGGCPKEYDPSAMYVEGDSVAVGGIVLKCRSWPNSLYCNLVAFEPLGQYSEMAWTKVGYCSGTIVSTPVTVCAAFDFVLFHIGHC